MEKFRHKKVLIVGIGRTGFALLNFFQNLECEIKVTDIRPIFDLNKAVKKLKKINPPPKMAFGEHLDEDFLNADIIVYSPSVPQNLPQLVLAREKGKEVYSEFALASKFCKKPIIAIVGSFGRTTIAHMIGFALKLSGKNIFVGGTSENPFINYATLPNKDEIDYVIVENSAEQISYNPGFSPSLTVFTGMSESFPTSHFSSSTEYIETMLSLVKNLSPSSQLVVNFDTLGQNSFFRQAPCSTYWYTRKSFVSLGVMEQIQGTHFYERRIHSNINYHSEFIVSKMRIVGVNNRENLLAAITACKILNVDDDAIQKTIERFPGIPHRLEFLVERNGVSFYNDSKSETMPDLIKSLKAFKSPVILIAGGKESENVDYAPYIDNIIKHTRVLVLVGESKEKMNRALGNHPQTFIVGSFEESVLFAYQKSRTDNTILLSPGNPSTDFFRDYEERGNYFKKLVFQL